jgi:hypothetical protein
MQFVGKNVKKKIEKMEVKKSEELGKRKVDKEIGRKLQRAVLRSQNYLFQLHLWLRLQLVGTCGLRVFMIFWKENRFKLLAGSCSYL